jgi:transketolase
MNRIPKLLSRPLIDSLVNYSKEVRKDVLRMIQNAGSGNPGSALSCVEILVWLLHHEMHIKINDPHWNLRDRLILSKGHAAPVFYAICSQLGWLKKSELLGFRRFNTKLQTHPEYNTLPFIDYTSGSLGQGLSAAVGMGLAANYLKITEPRFFVLLGDGEIQEGQIWEAAMSAGSYKLSNIVTILDYNKFQQDGKTESIMNIEPLTDKWISFNWEVKEADGHSFQSLCDALNSCVTSKPKLIIANTVKGKGISFMENNNDWHVGGEKFTEQVLNKALSEL